MALASEGDCQPISGSNDDHYQLKQRQINDKKVNFDTNKNSTKSINDDKSEVDYELPDHIVYKLYLNRLFSAFADRTWDYCCG